MALAGESPGDFTDTAFLWLEIVRYQAEWELDGNLLMGP
jgi:predicted YcjX-like family ATPase